MVAAVVAEAEAGEVGVITIISLATWPQLTLMQVIHKAAAVVVAAEEAQLQEVCVHPTVLGGK